MLRDPSGWNLVTVPATAVLGPLVLRALYRDAVLRLRGEWRWKR